MQLGVYKAATAAAQRVMTAFSPDLVVDGKWGNYTQAAFERLDANAKAQVLAVLDNYGASPSSLYQFRQDQKIQNEVLRGTDYNLVDPEDARTWLTRSATIIGIPAEYHGALVDFLTREPAKRMIQGKLFYLANSANGSSRGLGQIQPAAWTDARKTDPSLPGYDQVFDPRINLQAMAAYVKWMLKRWPKGVPVTGNNLYMAYNQGLGFLKSGKIIGKQSAPVMKMLNEYRAGLGK